MTSTLKRKRGPVEVLEPLKKTKSSKKNGVAASISDPSSVGWEAAFGAVKREDQITTVNEANLEATHALPITSEAEDYEEYVERSKKRQGQIDVLQKEIAKAAVPEWKFSAAVGGRMIDVDPVFTDDEKYLILAHRKSIKVYSTATSLQIRSISLRKDKSLQADAGIVAYALSRTNSHMIWVACSDGAVYQLDWTTGKGADQFWTISSTGIINMTVASIMSVGRRRDVVFTTEARRDGHWRITAHELTPPGSLVSTVARTIYSSNQQIQILKVSDDGLVITAASDNRVLVGSLRSPGFGTVDKIKYEFRIFDSSDYISCLDFRISSRATAGPKKGKSEKSDVVDVVVGDVKGTIFVHNDLIANLSRMQASGSSGTQFTPRKLHWHRKAVYSVKWSLDGNYIISGGSETVMVLWQLDTGRQQFLPHMSAAIQNILVSPRGTSYAIRLADNSAIVLSTAELKPTASISGLQSNVLQNRLSLESRVLRVGVVLRKNGVLPRTPALISPSSPSHLLLAVGEQQEVDSMHDVPAPFLQTFDIAASHTISRQALTRTNTTNINISPNALPLTEARVTHMQISYDGKWLATIDEWLPPRRDIELLFHSSANVEVEQRKRREAYLKFWQLNNSSGNWELVSRVDSPHAASRGQSVATRVLDLASNPSSVSFSSLGEDGVVCMWYPKTRIRDGIAVRDADGKPLTNWTCRHRISLARDDDNWSLANPSSLERLHVEHGCIAFSEDGSLLAAGMTGNRGGLINLIDPSSGLLLSTRANMYRGDIIKMALLAQHIIILSDDLRVFDLVLDELQYGISLGAIKSQLSIQQKAEMMHLAIDRESRTFAIALPYRQYWKARNEENIDPLSGAYSEVAVFDPLHSGALLSEALPHLVTALIPTVGSAGYLVLDGAAEITVISPKATQPLTSTAKPMSELRLDFRTEESPTPDLDQLAEESLDEPAVDVVMDDEIDDDGPPVVTQQQLASLFDVGPAFAMPPMEEMFYRVAGLVSRPPTKGNAV